MKYVVGDVIVLGNKEKYVIVKMVNVLDNNYYYVVLVDENKKMISNECKIIKIDTEDKVVIVNSKREFEKIIPLFMNLSQGGV